MEIELIQRHRSLININSFSSIYFTEFYFTSIIPAMKFTKIYDEYFACFLFNVPLGTDHSDGVSGAVGIGSIAVRSKAMAHFRDLFL
jgi:hypothetical protein